MEADNQVDFTGGSIGYLNPPLGSNGYTCPSCGMWIYNYQVHQCLPVVDIPGTVTVPGYYRYYIWGTKTVSTCSCGRQIGSDDVFCAGCGIRLKVKHKCPGHVYETMFSVGQAYCQYCGAKIKETED